MKSDGRWLPDMDLNHDKQIQSLLCYRYTIGQTSGSKVNPALEESRAEDCMQPPAWRSAAFRPQRLSLVDTLPIIPRRLAIGTNLQPEGRAPSHSCVAPLLPAAHCDF